MPSSDPTTIPKIMKLVETLDPHTILDVGTGNGRYGFLFREKLDWDWGRIDRDFWEVQIDGVEIEPRYVTPVHRYVYDYVYEGNWLELSMDRSFYDLIFMGDVLEHFKDGDWQKALSKARKMSGITMVVCPNWEGSIRQGAWGDNPYETHRVELRPGDVGGKCVYANSKCFISVIDNAATGVLAGRDILL